MTQTSCAPVHVAGAWDIYPPDGIGRRLRQAIKQVAWFCYLHCGWIQLRELVLKLLGRSRIVIIYYHRIGWVDVLSKPTSALRADLQYLARHYDCMTLSALCELLASGKKIRRKVAVVTFDDGYRDNYLAAFPELKRAGIPATFFVATGFIGTERVFPHDARAAASHVTAREDWPKMTWDELREMQQAGMEIGSHTVDHVNMGKADEMTVRQQAIESLAALNRELGERPRCFCYPWGKREDTSEVSRHVLREAGYVAAVTTQPGTVRRDDDLFALRRVDLGNGNMTCLASRAAIEGFGCGWLARLLRR